MRRLVVAWIASGLAALAASAALAPASLAQYPALDPARGVVTMAPLLERATPAVVTISVRSRAPGDQNPLMRDPFFRRFFDPSDRPPERETLAAGSGVIVDAKRGLVVTNNHVAANALSITITLKDRRSLQAELVGADPATDIALLRVPAEGLSQLAYGDSDELRVGDIVLAIGNPFGLGQTVTSGIVSALGRSGVTNGRYEDFVQTDAPINPGNSGGALIDTRGRLVGINTAIIAPGGVNVGIGFAVPSNMVRAVVEQILRHGEVRRGQIGVALQDLTPDLAKALGTEADRGGALIARVEPGGGAEWAGLRAGDLVTTFDGAPVRGAADLRNRLSLAEPGSTVELEAQRRGERRAARVRVEAATPAADSGGGDTGGPRLAGATVAEIPEDHPVYGLVEGALVTRVARGSPAASAGLRAGDIVLAVGGEPVASPDELRAALARAGRPLVLDLLRGDTQVRLTLR